MPEPAGTSLLDPFSALKGPRQQARVLYSFARDPAAPARRHARRGGRPGRDRARGPAAAALFAPVPARHLRDPEPRPPGRGARCADPALFKACFTSWAESRREEEPELIAVDGKTARRSHARAKGREPLHLVSAWAARQRLVLGQEAVAGTSNQIVAIPRLLERLALQGARVTIDRSAIGTQGATAETIRARGGDHLLALKANRPALLEEVAAFVADPPPGALLRHATTGGGHGRIESRRHAVGHQVARLLADRRHPGEITFPDLAMLGPAASPPPLRGIGPVARWSRPRPSAAARSSGSDAAISARPSSILRASPGRRAGRGDREPAALGPGRGVPRRSFPAAPRAAPASMVVVKRMALSLLR